MVNHTNLKEVVESNATSAYNRLEELQSQGVEVSPIPFMAWRDNTGELSSAPPLVPEFTTFFTDGWDRYTGSVKGVSNIPILELFVAGHNTVYAYSLDVGLTDNLESLRKEETR